MPSTQICAGSVAPPPVVAALLLAALVLAALLLAALLLAALLLAALLLATLLLVTLLLEVEAPPAPTVVAALELPTVAWPLLE